MTDETGTVAVETAVIAPVLLILLLLVVYAGRAARIDGEVRTAAGHAARAASIAADPTSAEHAARTTVETNLADAQVVCTDLQVTTDTDSWTAGGHVQVDVGCLVSNTDIALLLVPGTRWSHATAVQPIDRHRGGT